MKTYDDGSVFMLNALRDLYLFIIIMTSILCCSGCSSARPVILERVYHDTVHVDRLRLDSILLHDSVRIETAVRGDTVYRTKEVTRFRYRTSVRRDTVYLVYDRTDDIPVPQERKATFWDKLFCTETLCFAIAWVFIATLIWLYHRKR